MSTPNPKPLVLTDADLDELQGYVDAHDWIGLPFAVDRVSRRVAERVLAREIAALILAAGGEVIVKTEHYLDDGDFKIIATDEVAGRRIRVVRP